MKESVEKIVRKLVGEPDAVEVSEESTDRATVVKVRVAAEDMGRIIGREGRTIKAIRCLLFYAGQKQGKRFVLDVVE
ncbi:MAG TPA: KH domain-containing protein [Pyrinomonadaceae bacterium]|nr:KH domain-containing protein [Pyrinomonadaceae bacterium]